jgi:hypothetical protein
MADQSSNSVASVRLTHGQKLVLAGLMVSITLVITWIGVQACRMSQPSVLRQVRDRSVIGRSIGSLRYWEGEPDGTSRVPGWDYTYTAQDTFDKNVFAAIKVDEAGKVVDCAVFAEYSAVFRR